MSISRKLFRLLQSVPDRDIFAHLKKDTDRKTNYFDMLLEQEREGRGSRSGITKTKVIEDFIRAQWGILADNLSDAEGDPRGRLFIHRCLSVDNTMRFVGKLSEGKIDGDDDDSYSGLGSYWTWDYAKAECYRGDRFKEKVILTGLMEPGGIDLRQTVFANFDPFTGYDEKEIFIKDGETIWLTEVSTKDRRNNTVVIARFDPEIGLPA